MVHECSKLIIIYGLAGCETGKMNGLDGFFFKLLLALLSTVVFT